MGRELPDRIWLCGLFARKKAGHVQGYVLVQGYGHVQGYVQGYVLLSCLGFNHLKRAFNPPLVTP